MSQPNSQNPDLYQSSFQQLEKNLNGEAKSPLHALRKEAITKFASLGFPTTNDEEWRFTNVGPIAKAKFAPALQYSREGLTVADVSNLTLGNLEAIRLVFINAHYSPELSSAPSVPGLRISSIADAIVTKAEQVNNHLAKYVKYDENGFTALSTAFLLDGAYVEVDEATHIEAPIHLMFVTAGQKSVTTTPRNLIIVGEGSKVSIIESYTSIASVPHLTNAVTEFIVGENAVVEHDKLQDESLDAFHVSTVHFQQHARSNVVSNAINLGGSLVRNNITMKLDGEGIEATLNGLSLGTGNQHIDNHTVIDHAKPNCVSHESYKAILDGTSRGVFNGKIFVRKDAQKTDAKQTNKTLLLSDHATIDTKPQLEIFADDVKCTHGATVGYLDDEQMFYLRSRGIGQETAKDILTFAFAVDVIHRIHVEPLRDKLEGMIHERLQQGRQVEV